MGGICCVAVPQSSVAMIERFGKFSREAHAGFNCVCCICGEASAGTVSLRLQQLLVKCDTKTKDNVFVSIDVAVQYQAMEAKVYDAFYKLTDPHQQIKAYVFDVVRACVPKITLDEVFETKEEIAHAVKKELEQDMEEYGYDIIQTLITDIIPDANVKKAMNEINAAERRRVAAQDKAEAEKIRIVKAAEADAESKYLAGVGISRQRLAIIEGLRDSVQGFTDSVGASTKDVMDLILVTQYFDTIKDIGSHSGQNTLFLPHSPGAVESVSDQIARNFNQLQGVPKKRSPNDPGKEKLLLPSERRKLAGEDDDDWEANRKKFGRKKESKVKEKSKEKSKEKVEKKEDPKDV